MNCVGRPHGRSSSLLRAPVEMHRRLRWRRRSLRGRNTGSRGKGGVSCNRVTLQRRLDGWESSYSLQPLCFVSRPPDLALRVGIDKQSQYITNCQAVDRCLSVSPCSSSIFNNLSPVCTSPKHPRGCSRPAGTSSTPLIMPR